MKQCSKQIRATVVHIPWQRMDIYLIKMQIFFYSNSIRRQKYREVNISLRLRCRIGTNTSPSPATSRPSSASPKEPVETKRSLMPPK